MTAIFEKGGGSFQGTKMLLCENPLPPLDEAVAAAQSELPLSNYYSEPYSEPLPCQRVNCKLCDKVRMAC